MSSPDVSGVALSDDSAPRHRHRNHHRNHHVRLARPALALGAGALTAFSLPPWGFWPLAIVGVMLFDVSL
ncbi:MAG: hypothetical protein ACI9AO_000780, partial [Ilumatobacter sp.]